ncbi:MAG: cation-transporting P-type ATPase [Acidimicrobiales bacterium]
MSTPTPSAPPDATGLSTAEAADRLRTHGPNRLTEAPGRPAWRVFVDQFRNLLVIVLIAAAVLAGLVGDLKDVVVISVVLLLNAVLGFVQEHRADQSLAALRSMLTPTTRPPRRPHRGAGRRGAGAGRRRAAGGGRPGPGRRRAAGGARSRSTSRCSPASRSPPTRRWAGPLPTGPSASAAAPSS